MDEFLLILLGMLCLAGHIALWYFIADRFSQIAAMKGHTEKCYFWWTFMLGLVGMLMVASLPSVTEAPTAARSEVIYDDVIPSI